MPSSTAIPNSLSVLYADADAEAGQALRAALVEALRLVYRDHKGFLGYCRAHESGAQLGGLYDPCMHNLTHLLALLHSFAPASPQPVELPVSKVGAGAHSPTNYGLTAGTIPSTEQPNLIVDQDRPLSEPEQEFLLALYELRAFESSSRRTTKEVSKQAAGEFVPPRDFKRCSAALRMRGLTDSLSAPGGGIWLTRKGRQMAERLAALASVRTSQ